MPLNLLKKYNELLDLLGMSEGQRTHSLRGVFNRDIQDNNQFSFMGKPIFPTPKEDGEIAMETLFSHLTTKTENKELRNRVYDAGRSMRLHWIRYHVEKRKPEDILYFSANDSSGPRTYIYDIREKYVIVLEPLRNNTAYYLLSAYHLEGKDAARDKIMQKYRRRRLPNIL